MRMRTARRLSAVGAFIVLILAASAVSAAGASPKWRLLVNAPDDVTAGRPALIAGTVENVGDVPLSGNMTLVNAFPAGITPEDASLEGGSGWSCNVVAQTDVCTVNVDGMVPGAQLRFRWVPIVDVSAAGTLVNELSVTGGGMPQGVTQQQIMTVGPRRPFDVKGFSMDLLKQNGDSALRAASVPAEVSSTLAFRSASTRLFESSFFFIVANAPSDHFKNTVVHTPAGIVGNPTATPVRCTASQLNAPSPDTNSANGSIPNCPQDSQVGVVYIAGGSGYDIAPLYNMVPPPGAPAQFGFSYATITVVLTAQLRAADNGIDIVALKAPSSIPIPRILVTLWGIPADRSHDTVRHACLDRNAGNDQGRMCPASAPRKPFLRMPTSCTGGPLPWAADITTYEHPGEIFHSETTSPGMEGCQFVPFDPTFSLLPTNQRPHSATGVDATLQLPQDQGPDGLAQADLRTATVTLPVGMSISPSSANGLQACTDAELRLGIDGVATCPDASKIGTVSLVTPLLDHPLSGSIFLRTQASDDPASGEMFRIAVEVRSDDDGVDLKLPGAVKLDPFTGQVTTVFDELPQLPFSTMQLHFKSGPRAPLTSPRRCGTYTTSVEMVSWSDKIVPTSSSFDISGNGRGAACPASRFGPVFEAGVKNPVAGKSSPYVVSLDRDDSDELFKTLAVESPKGLLGRIKNAEQCSDAAANAGTCGAGSLIGSATVASGAGPNPFYITDGKVYLTGPYKGAPFGLSVVTRAVAGPFDLGTVVVRAAIHLDKRTAQIRVISEPFPTVVKGVPLDLRAVRLSIDKPDFMVNPTSCARQQVGATVTSTEGSTAQLSDRFQVANCKNLKFSPRISMRVGASGRTSQGGSTPLVTTIRQARGESNLAGVKVSLPTVLNSRLSVVNRACTLAQFEADDCDRAEVGSAVAVTPLLKDPLRGAAYLVRDPAGGLPDVMIALRGDVDLDVVGEVEIPRSNRLNANFETIPDAPITRFTLRLFGGRNGPIGIVSNLCGRRARNARVAITMRGQNGAKANKSQRLRVQGCGGR